MIALKENHLAFLIIVVASCIFSFNLFVHSGEPATFDGPTHITTMYQVAQILKDGEFPVTWLQNFAHYGSPIPLYAQQTTMYLGAALTLLLRDPVLGSKVLVFLITLLGGWGMYLLLRRHADPLPAIVGTILFMFTPYRILNTYVRGAFPEFAAQSIVPYMLLLANYFVQTKAFRYVVGVSLVVALLTLTHTFMLIIALPLVLLYSASMHRDRKQLLILAVAVLLGLGLSGYYLIPLTTEIKYFYYGLEPNHFKEGQFLQLKNFLDPYWPYLTRTDVFTRPHKLIGGLIEAGLIVLSTMYYGVFVRKSRPTLGILMTLTSLIYIVFMLPISEPLYRWSSFLGNIQHPWRMMAGYSLTIPFLLTLGLNIVKNRTSQKYISLGVVALIMILAVPNLYAKNYTLYPLSHYAFTKENLHGNAMIPLWAGEPEDYLHIDNPIRVIEGEAQISPSIERNTFRQYHIIASTDVRLAVYTFYFPGWEVFLGNEEIPIEFQDINYRGLITFRLSQGEHNVIVKFSLTRKRLAGYMFSSMALVLLGISWVGYRRYEKKVH